MIYRNTLIPKKNNMSYTEIIIVFFISAIEFSDNEELSNDFFCRGLAFGNF